MSSELSWYIVGGRGSVLQLRKLDRNLPLLQLQQFAKSEQTLGALMMMMSFTVCWEPGVTHKTCFSNS